MKKASVFGGTVVAILVCVGLGASQAVAGETPAQPAPKAAASAEKTTTHEMTVTVVSADPKTHMLTIKDDQGQEHSAKCMGAAMKEMAGVKAGDKVTLTCKDNAKGEHLGVISIKPAKS